MNNTYPIDIIPENDADRVAALNRYQIFNSERETTFDNIAKLAKTIFKVPIAHISFLGAEHEFVKASAGIPDIGLVDRGESLCALTVLKPEVLVTIDALKEPLLANHPAVHGDLGLRFYAGAPIITTDDYIIGTICLVDHQPRSLTPHEIDILRDLAGVVMDQVELRLSNMEKSAAQQNLMLQKDEFISIASHELRTPITSLKASLQLLDRIKSEPNTPILPTLIVQANKSLDKLNSLVADLLDVNQIAHGHLMLRKSVFKIADMINDSCQFMQIVASHQIHVSGDLDLKVDADEQRLGQVLINMVNNAIKYAPNSRRVDISIARSGEYAKIMISDYGPGIAPNTLPHLFERYYRGEYGGVQLSGLGLGLYICSDIVKKHGGEIGVDTSLEKGSTFWFTLPLGDY